MPQQFYLRFPLLLIGLMLMAFGVVLSIRSDLGTSPISSLPYVYSFIVPLSVGVLTIAMHIVMIILQKLLLGNKFTWTRYLQLPIGIIFSLGIDVLLWLTQNWQADNYIQQLLYCLSSCMITAIGVCMLVKANLVFFFCVGLYQAFALRFNWNFGSCKSFGAMVLVLLAVISSYIGLHYIVGIREGTIISALLVGFLVKQMLPRLAFIQFK